MAWRRGQAKGFPGDTKHGKYGMGVRGEFGLGEPVCRVLTLFLAHSFSSYSSCFFFQLCCAATARANLGQTQADHITIDLTCIALHAARPRLSGPQPKKPVS